MATTTLPRFIVLKHQKNDKYLIHQRDDKDRLLFSGTDFESQHVKFEVVPSSTKGSDLVHLKCCYNNRYWVIHPNQDFLVSADALEKEEDQSKPLCTLFKPIFFISNRIGFYHVYLKSNVMFDDQKPFYLAGCPNLSVIENEGDYLDFEDWESLPILPEYFALKSVPSGLYLNTFSEETTAPNSLLLGLLLLPPITGVPSSTQDGIRKLLLGPVYIYHLRFNCKDKGEQGVSNRVFKNPDRTIRIKNLHSGRFWRRSPNWIRPDSSDETCNDRDTLFKVVKLAHNRIALQNLGNDKFCESLSVEGNNDGLNANTTTIPDTAHFEVEELVDSRQIYNVRFNDTDARVYKKEILHMVRMTDINNTSEKQENTFDFAYEDVEIEEWKLSSSTKLSVETQITFGIPDVVEGNVKLGAEVTKEVSEGKTTSKKKEEKYGKKIYVKPGTRVVMDFKVMHAICDIPYSYTVRETLTNGLIVLGNDRDDGLYTSIKTFVEFNATEMPAK